MITKAPTGGILQNSFYSFLQLLGILYNTDGCIFEVAIINKYILKVLSNSGIKPYLYLHREVACLSLHSIIR